MKKIIFIILILILSTSFCYAYTWDEFIEFCGNASNYVNTNDLLTACNNVYTNATLYENLFTSNNVNIDDYDSFILFRSTSGRFYRLALLNSNITLAWNYPVGR